MILELDIGNSRVKWRLVPGQQTGVVASMEELLNDFKELPKPDQVRVASVRRDQSIEAISAWTKSNWALVPQLAVVSAASNGVTNSYQDISRMGVDRWLAMLAGFHRAKSACVIVDGGTALTIDAIDGSGQHLGGYILPGLQLMLDSLEGNTGIRLASREFNLVAELGKNTEHAVLNGALAQVLALVSKVVNDLAESEDKVSVLLSGGDADLLQQALAESAIAGEICPSLVMDGLEFANLEEAE